MHAVLRAKFGDKLVIRPVTGPQGWGLRRLGFGTAADVSDSFIASMETRALWSRFGL